MSYTITLRCGCSVYVSCHPDTHVAHTHVIEARGAHCPDRRHERGARLSADHVNGTLREPPPHDLPAQR